MSEYPECPICLDIFGNNKNHIRIPKILKCGDNICKECLEVIIKNTEEESFLCPTCKEKIKKEQYIDDYVTNRVIIKIINDSFNINLNEIKDENQAPIEYNIILLGNTSVGKTSILHRLSEDIFSERISSTIGCDMSAYYIKYKNKKYRIILRDSSGQERYRAITKNFLRNSDGVLFVYDITNKTSFDDLESWYDLYTEENEKVVGLLIGNKCDSERQVDEEEAIKFAKEHNLKKYFETSAKLDKKIKKAIATLLEEIIKSQYIGNTYSCKNSDFFSIHSKKTKRKKQCDC